MNHLATPEFWKCYQGLPGAIRDLADKNFALLKLDPSHPSPHFKKVGQFWSSRAGLHYRAPAVETNADVVWFWIGSHADYDRIIGR
jgi:hypothetical protein